jgi:hypothetical protein
MHLFKQNITAYSHAKRKPFKTSLYTMFGVLLFPQFSGSNTFMRLADVQRESATYNWPCEKTADRRSKPTCLTDWPCDLFMVIAKARRTGNCLRRSGIGRVSLEGVNEIRGISTLFPENLGSPESIPWESWISRNYSAIQNTWSDLIQNHSCAILQFHNNNLTIILLISKIIFTYDCSPDNDLRSIITITIFLKTPWSGLTRTIYKWIICPDWQVNTYVTALFFFRMSRYGFVEIVGFACHRRAVLSIYTLEMAKPIRILTNFEMAKISTNPD